MNIEIMVVSSSSTSTYLRGKGAVVHGVSRKEGRQAPARLGEHEK